MDERGRLAQRGAVDGVGCGVADVAEHHVHRGRVVHRAERILQIGQAVDELGQTQASLEHVFLELTDHEPADHAG